MGETPTVFHPRAGMRHGCWPAEPPTALSPLWASSIGASELWCFEAGQLCSDLVSHLNSWVASVCFICRIGWLDFQKHPPLPQPSGISNSDISKCIPSPNCCHLSAPPPFILPSSLHRLLRLLWDSGSLSRLPEWVGLASSLPTWQTLL